jgi:DNA-directed RNA polymerase subunit RPC12/RpoP
MPWRVDFNAPENQNCVDCGKKFNYEIRYPPKKEWNVKQPGLLCWRCCAKRVAKEKGFKNSVISFLRYGWIIYSWKHDRRIWSKENGTA